MVQSQLAKKDKNPPSNCIILDSGAFDAFIFYISWLIIFSVSPFNKIPLFSID